MKCPKCDGEFESRSVGDIRIDECTECHGVWFDSDELSQATKQIDQDLRWMEFDLWKDQNLFQVSQGGMKCPRCHTVIAAVKYGPTEGTVDTCVKCRGVWLDKGEFEQIIAALEAELVSMSEDEYRAVALREARDLVDGEGHFISDWRDFRTVVRFLQYRILVENPKVSEALSALQRGSPFQ